MPLGLRAQLVACLDHLRQEPQESMATYCKRTKLLKEQLDLIPGGAAFATDVILRERFATGITNVRSRRFPTTARCQLNALTLHVLAGKPNRGKGTPAVTGVPGQPRSGGNPQHTPAPRYQPGPGTGRGRSATAAVTTRQGKRADAQSRRRHHVQFDGEAHDLLQMNTLTVQTASTLTQAADIDSNLLYLPIQIESDRAEQPREILALLDTGAQASILSRAIVDELRLSTHKIATPVKVQSAKDDRSVIRHCL
ncbi:hypothetical protein GUITHDRAFT_120320 [Guillardia theta CCMP2712]|uniref:Peptidase A2 domain-containing protein n=1 Tax=Guillardia theta (strain CCMP2712) TaxID=905079 RepID=L1IBB3_GUITC|nr:hypothetical protein GUITHDRAFT_120320 [Guillardia theta CCMP2712]EKX33518.1 hypothetical protein GUITHDRAFT_120320 [Guillardia theta CCMP2712]|eukprot:XP_005820498.1 hypothetical protein GUITHDRAFT_120320 [Guillardia theta CCMP2712]